MTNDTQPTDLPTETVSNGWKVWGIPTSIIWWKNQTTANVTKITSYNIEQECGGKSCFASLVAGAIEEVQSWIQAGVKVKDSRWVDVGGGDGYYSIALKLLGAKSVCLLDIEPPSKLATPVLEAVGVEVVEGDGGSVEFCDIDSIALLYVPDLELSNVFMNYPDLTMAVVSSDMFNDDFAEIAGWRSYDVTEGKRHFTIGEGNAVFSHDAHYLDDDLMCYFGDKIMDETNVSRQLQKIVEEYSE